MAGSLAFGNWPNCDVYLVFGNLLIYIARETIIITMPANAATLPACPGPILARTARPLLTGGFVALSSAPGPLFSGFVAALSLAHLSVSWVKFFFHERWCIDSLEHALTTETKASRTAYTLVSSAKTELGTFPAHVPTSSPKWCGCPGPSCRLDGSCQCIRDKFPSPAAITSDRCPALPSALPGPALCWLLVAWSLLTRLAYLTARLSSLLFCFPVYCRRTGPVHVQLREAACAWPAARR